MEDDFDIDTSEVDPAASTTTAHVFDPGGSRETAEALRALGMSAQTVQLGSALMAAAQARQVAGVVVAAGADPELRELFMRAFRSRFSHVPVLYFSVDHQDPAAVKRLLDEGARAVLPWPIADGPGTLGVLQQHLPVRLFGAAGAEAGFDVDPAGATVVAPKVGAPRVPAALDLSPLADFGEPEPDAKTKPIEVPSLGLASVPDGEAEVLARKVNDLEEQGPVGAISAEELEAAVKEVVEKKSAENTELRSELTLVRDRNQLLEDRVRRLTSEVRALTDERDRLVNEISGLQPSGALGGGLPSGGVAEELRRGTESYIWALETTIQFMEDLKTKVGSRAPSLDTHLRTLRLAKGLIERIGEEAKAGVAGAPQKSKR